MRWIAWVVATLLAQFVAPALWAQQGTWEILAPMPIGNSEFGAETAGRRILLFGGYLHANSDALHIYEPATGLWSQGAPLPRNLHHTGVAAIGPCVYLFGGGAERSDKVHIFDTTNDTWRSGTPMPTARTAMAAVVVDDRVHVIGGSVNINFGVALGAHEVYDPRTDSWAVLAALPIPVEHVSAAVIGRRNYVAGGRDGLKNRGNLQIYDLATGAWSRGAGLPVHTSGMSLEAFRGQLFVVGGEDLFGGTVIGAVQLYNPVTDTWTRHDDLAIGVHGAASAVEGRSLYVFGDSAVAASGKGAATVRRLLLPAGPKPATPTALSAPAAGEREALLRWRDNATNETLYQIQAEQDGTGGFALLETRAADAELAYVSRLAHGARYRFRVRAKIGSKVSEWSQPTVLQVP